MQSFVRYPLCFACWVIGFWRVLLNVSLQEAQPDKGKAGDDDDAEDDDDDADDDEEED